MYILEQQVYGNLSIKLQTTHKHKKPPKICTLNHKGEGGVGSFETIKQLCQLVLICIQEAQIMNIPLHLRVFGYNIQQGKFCLLKAKIKNTNKHCFKENPNC